MVKKILLFDYMATLINISIKKNGNKVVVSMYVSYKSLTLKNRSKKELTLLFPKHDRMVYFFLA